MKNKLLFMSCILSISLVFSSNVFADEATNTKFIAGDVDGDEQVTTIDANLLKNYLVGQETLPDDKLMLADIDGDGKITSSDYSLMKRFLSGKTSKLPVNNSNVPTATVEQAGTAIIGKTVILVSLPSNVDATRYDVSISGKALTYDATIKKFTVVLDGTFTKEELQSKIVVTAK